MKNMKYIYLVVMVAVFICCSCSKKNNPATAKQSISFKFNDTSYATTNVQVLSEPNLIRVNGTFNSQSFVLLQVENPTIGSFNVPGIGGVFQYFTGSIAQNDFYEGYGTIVITSLTSTSLAGTFELSAENPSGVKANITQGQFQVNIPQ
jgi:hypothetical protein